MNILSQILNISSKNLLIETSLHHFKEKLHNFLDKLLFETNHNFINIIIEMQTLLNDFIKSFIVKLIETIDYVFKYSQERKEKYYINKLVYRTIFTIFGEIHYKRTLYINKYTNEYYNYIDDVLNIESYKTYDPVVRAILVNESCLTNSNHTSINSSLNYFNLKNYLSENINLIPRSTIYNFKKETKIKKVNYDLIETNKTLYIMVDEKWIHEQDKLNPNTRKYIMSKCFVTFTGINRKGKRSRLIGRHIFITSSNNPWKKFAEEIYNIYDFEKIETINLLSDAGSWILSGKDEIKFYTNNKITVNTCEFHVKQKINRATTDKNLRIKIADIIYEQEDKNEFIKEMDKLIDSKDKESKKQKITEYKNYILRHWKGIINMKHSLCKSSMEAHIQHCIASSFSSVPKGYSSNNIECYLKLQEMLLNGINIMKYYLTTYNKNNTFVYNEKEIDFSIFEKPISSNIPNKSSSNPSSLALYNIAYPTF